MPDEKSINDSVKSLNKELQAKHQEMLLNKKRIDIDNVVESILLFFNNYFPNFSFEVANKIKEYKNITVDNPYNEIINGLVTSFFSILETKIKETTINQFGSIKNNMSLLSDEECNKELRHVSNVIANEISDCYLENAVDLVKELNNNDADKNVNDYILKVVYNRLMNTFKNCLVYSVKVIDNNYEENTQIMQIINEKAFNKV